MRLVRIFSMQYCILGLSFVGVGTSAHAGDFVVRGNDGVRYSGTATPTIDGWFTYRVVVRDGLAFRGTGMLVSSFDGMTPKIVTRTDNLSNVGGMFFVHVVRDGAEVPLDQCSSVTMMSNSSLRTSDQTFVLRDCVGAVYNVVSVDCSGDASNPPEWFEPRARRLDSLEFFRAEIR